ncbi:hypothetical protein [Streptomyces erythrochromogenes]|uniref:hypothetical protein n=1 Tax=Streptomyces erythrochromogenes TaxID=285574 RepID=UPI00340CD748
MAVAASPRTGTTAERPPAPAARMFRLTLPPAELIVHSALPGLREAIGALVHPLFEVTDVEDAESPGVPRLTVTARAADSGPPAPWAAGTAPQLLVHPDGPRYTVLERVPERTVLLRDGEADSAPLLVTAVPATGRVAAEVPDTGPAAVRAVVRLLGTLIGAQLTGRDAVFLHGSAVAVGGSSVMMLGPKHRGKSSLAFLAVTRGGADFVSDDTLVAWAPQPGEPPALRGWPKRVGISKAVLAGHPARHAFERATLRRHGSGTPQVPADAAWSTSPGGRERLFADLDEFTALTGAAVATGSRPAGVLLPLADRDRRGWEIEPVTDPSEALDEALLSGPDLRHFTDYLGLLPRPVPEPAVRAGVLAAFGTLPCVRVRYGPDVNDDFPRFWDEVTGALDLPGGAR